MEESSVRELINRRRRQILIHSVIYYRFNDNLISDHTWSVWAQELFNLQQQYPEIAARCVFSRAYENFDPSTGYNLPLDDAWAFATANMLLRYYDNHIRNGEPLLFRWEK